MDRAIAATFRDFARAQYRGISARYEMLAELVASQPELARPLLAAPEEFRTPDLLFASVQYVLRGPAADHPLARFLPTLDGTLEPGPAMAGAFADFVGEYGAQLSKVCAQRPAQGNEALRSAVLWPGLCLAGQVAGDRGVCLLEIGAGAGVLLLPDRFAIRYAGGQSLSGHRQVCGRPDAPPSLVLDCEVRGDAWPDCLDIHPAIADRVGIDLAPVDPGNPDDVRWVRSNVWPEHVRRLARLDAALVEVGVARPRIVAGRVHDLLEPVLSTVDAGLVPCVIAANVMNYLPVPERSAFVRTVVRAAAKRDLVILFNDLPEASSALFTADAGDYFDPARAAGVLTLVTFTAGTPSVELLARTGPFGSWLEWAPRACGYAPSVVSLRRTATS
jgi:hypothetical protein